MLSNSLLYFADTLCELVLRNRSNHTAASESSIDRDAAYSGKSHGMIFVTENMGTVTTAPAEKPPSDQWIKNE